MILSHISTSPESDSLYQLSNEEGSGSGGSPVAPDEWTDDEDAERGWPEQGSGSGEAATDISGNYVQLFNYLNLVLDVNIK